MAHPLKRDFALEIHFARWEFRARYHMTASDAESLTLGELLSYATTDDRAAFEQARLGYSETYGAPDLRAAIAETYDTAAAEDILCFVGAEEGLYAGGDEGKETGQQQHAFVVWHRSLRSWGRLSALCSKRWR